MRLLAGVPSRFARALRNPYTTRSAVATTIAPALTATIVILAEIYLHYQLFPIIHIIDGS